MLNLLLFWIELTTYLCLFYNILHSKARKASLHFLAFVLVTAIWFVYNRIAETPNPDTFCILIIILCIIKEKWYFNLCWTVVFTLFLNIFSNISTYTYYCITKDPLPFDTRPHKILSALLCILIIAISFYIDKKRLLNRDSLQQISWKGYCLLYFVVLVDFILSSLSSLLIDGHPIEKHLSHILMTTMFIVILMSVILLILYFRLQHCYSLLQQTNAIQSDLLTLEAQHYQDLQQKTLDLRTFRHDYQYHITAMQGLVKKSDWVGLEQYITNLSQIKDQTYYLSTSHPVADAIINDFYKYIPDHTELQINGKLSEKIFLSDTDLCIILSNLLQNAIEAQNELPADKFKSIQISLHSDEQSILIQSRNTAKTYEPDKLINLTTSKADTVNHGFGLLNIRNVVSKYDGKLDLLYENMFFTTSVYLRNTH